MLRLLCVLLVGAVVAQDHEEVFTIFIDLEDFHVTEADNHHFLSGDSIGEHNNVVLHMSEAEVKYHQDLHDTHHCEAPSEVHEVVSFIQEKMSEAPSAPSFIDDAIASNYNGDSRLWDNMFRQQAAAPNPQFPFPGMMGGGMFGMPPMGKGNPNAMMGLGAPPPPAPAAPVAPAAKVEKKADAPEAKVLSPEEEETQAVSRFRDAYKAYKLLNHALEGLGEYAQPAQNALTGTGASPQKSLWDSVVDDDDRKIMSLFSGQGVGAPAAPRPVNAPMMMGGRGNFDDQISSIVDDTFKNVMQELANPNNSGAVQAMNDSPGSPFGDIPSELDENEPEHHHHHHHHHHEEEEAPSAPAAPVPIVAAQSSGTELLDAPPSTAGLTPEEQKELNALLAKANAAKAAAPAPEPAAEAAPAPAKAVSAPNPGSRPSAPVLTSHIGKAPSAKDIIPESVYIQQNVPFKEVLAKEMKHVPKRILIPRMEEPGPVIGGSSRPLHIKINPEDILDAKDAKDSVKSEMSMSAPASRPAAPMHISISSEITNTNQGQSSEKASAVAAANDEALTAPEVVIF